VYIKRYILVQRERTCAPYMHQLHMEAEPQEEPPVAQFKLETYVDIVNKQMNRSIKLMEKRLRLQKELDAGAKFKELEEHNKKVDANLEQEIKRIEMERVLAEKELFNYIYGRDAPRDESQNERSGHVSRYMNAKQLMLTEAHKQQQEMEASFQTGDLKNQYITRCDMKKQEIAMNESMRTTINKSSLEQVMNMDTLNLDTETNGSERPEPEGEMCTDASASTIPGVGKWNACRSGSGTGNDPMRRSGYTPLARTNDGTAGMSSNHFMLREKAGTLGGKENKDFVDDTKSGKHGVDGGLKGGENGGDERKNGGLRDGHGRGVFLPRIQGAEDSSRPEVHGTTPTINGEPDDKAGQERAPENADYAPPPYEGRSHVRTSSGRQRVRGPLGRGHRSQSPDMPVTRGGITLSGTRHREREEERDIICHSRSTVGGGEIVGDIGANLMEDEDAAPSNTTEAQLNTTRKNANGKRRRSTLTKYDEMVKKMREEGYHAHNKLYTPMNAGGSSSNQNQSKTPVRVCIPPNDADVHEYVPESPPAHEQHHSTRFLLEDDTVVAHGTSPVGVQGAPINLSPITNPKSPSAHSFVTERAYPMPQFGTSGQPPITNPKSPGVQSFVTERAYYPHQGSAASMLTTKVMPSPPGREPIHYAARGAPITLCASAAPEHRSAAPIDTTTIAGTFPRLIPMPVLPPQERLSLTKFRADMNRGSRLRSPMLQSPRDLLVGAHNMMLQSATGTPDASLRPMGNDAVLRAHTMPPPLQRGEAPTAPYPAAPASSEDDFARDVLACGCSGPRLRPDAPGPSALSAYRGGPGSPPPSGPFRAADGAQPDDAFLPFGFKCEEHSEYLATIRGATHVGSTSNMRGMSSSDNNEGQHGFGGCAPTTAEEATFEGGDTTCRVQSLPPRFVDAPQGIRSPLPRFRSVRGPITDRSQVDQTRPMGIRAHLRMRFPISSTTDAVRPLRITKIEPRQLPTPATPQLSPMPRLRAPQVFPQNVCSNNGVVPARGMATRQPITLAAPRMRDVRLPLAEAVQRQAQAAVTLPAQNTAPLVPRVNAEDLPKVIPPGAIIYRYNSNKDLVPKEDVNL